MLIPVTVSPASPSNPKLPPGLAKISHDEVALIELQGSLEVEASRPEEQDGKFVGKLNMDNPVSRLCCLFFSSFLLPKGCARAGKNHGRFLGDVVVLTQWMTA